VKVGDLVRFKQQPDPARGIVVKIRYPDGNRRAHRFGVLWTGTGFDKMENRICWQVGDNIEVVHESR
jgi:hypothetical protein